MPFVFVDSCLFLHPGEMLNLLIHDSYVFGEVSKLLQAFLTLALVNTGETIFMELRWLASFV